MYDFIRMYYECRFKSVFICVFARVHRSALQESVPSYSLGVPEVEDTLSGYTAKHPYPLSLLTEAPRFYEEDQCYIRLLIKIVGKLSANATIYRKQTAYEFDQLELFSLKIPA